MGYACPVCEAPQQDAGHLANHLAFTTMLGDDDHEAWLDEHAPGWADQGERELADRVADHADETEFPQVFEDTTGAGDQREPADERSGALFEDSEARSASERSSEARPSDGRTGSEAIREPGDPRDDAHGHVHGHDLGHSHDSGHSPGHQHGHDLPTDVDPGKHTADPDDPEAQEILEDAREMTREMLGVDDEGDERDDGSDDQSDESDHAAGGDAAADETTDEPDDPSDDA